LTAKNRTFIVNDPLLTGIVVVGTVTLGACVLSGKISTDLLLWLATGFGAGRLPWAPGTFGTVVAVPLVILLQPLGVLSYAGISLGLLLTGIVICDKAASRMGVHDDPSIVWDEIVGYAITMIAVPASVPALLAGFVLFRLFDITKPWPICWLDRNVAGGLGIMLDDVAAAMIANLILQVFIQFGWLI